MSKRSKNSININARYDARQLATVLNWLEQEGVAIQYGSNILQRILSATYLQVAQNYPELVVHDRAEAFRILGNRRLMRPSEVERHIQLNIASNKPVDKLKQLADLAAREIKETKEEE